MRFASKHMEFPSALRILRPYDRRAVVHFQMALVQASLAAQNLPKSARVPSTEGFASLETEFRQFPQPFLVIVSP